MNKTIAMLALALLLSAISCALIPAEQPEPLVLPYPLYEQEYKGNQVTVTLQIVPDGPAPYGFHIAAHTAEGQTKLGVYVIKIILTEGYQQGKSMDWNELIGDQTGSGGLWEGETLGSEDLTSTIAYGLEATGDRDYPVAVFVRVVAADPGDPNITYEEMQGPVAVLQILPDDQGVVRLDR